MAKKFALMHMGNDETYGLLFVASELLKNNHVIRWFDADEKKVLDLLMSWKPDFVCFSPLSTFFEKSVELARKVKRSSPDIRTVFGGHHVFAVTDSINREEIDMIVIGPVYETIDKIISSPPKTIIKATPVPPDEMSPSRLEYYDAIPRMAKKYRKYVMTQFGCIYNCSYCSVPLFRRTFGQDVYRNFWLKRRSPSQVIKEIKFLKKYDAKEISLEDDDILVGDGVGSWLKEFAHLWKKEINFPAYANVTPNTVVKASDEALESLSEVAGSVQMGVQAARSESLKLFNRAFQTEKQVKEAYGRLRSFGIKVKMEVIVGLPVKDPVEDAIETVEMLKRVSPGTFIGCFPLMLYPGTALYEMCLSKNIKLNDACEYEWHTGEGSIKFPPEEARKIKNITKMATMFVKYNIDERWMRAFIDVELTEEASRKLSEAQFMESLIFRQGESARKDFDKILSSMHFRY